MWLSSPRIYARLAAAWLALAICGLLVGLRVWQELAEGAEQQSRAEMVSLKLDRVRAILEEADAGESFYLLTGEDRYLAPFRRAESDVAPEFLELSNLLPNSQGDREVLFTLRTATERLMDQMRRVESERSRSVLTRPRIAALSADQHQAMEAIRTGLDGLARDSERLLSAAGGLQLQGELRRALMATLLMGFLGLGAGAFAVYFSRLAVEKERNEHVLAEQAQRAERTAQEKSRFLANMSHEIRTPMNAILGFSELLTTELPSGSRARRFAQTIRESSLSLLQLINDVLDLSKVEAGMIELNLEPASVTELVDFLRAVLAQQAARKDLRLVLEADPNLPKALMLDRSRLRQVLVNLLGNAIKFTQHGGVFLKVRWIPDREGPGRGSLNFEVRDTGPGIPAEKQQEIFQPFSQVDPARPEEREGTGLGLSIVKRLVERMGGTISLESAEGAGATFRVSLADIAVSARLPVAARLELDADVDFNHLAPSAILVVDDHPANRDLLAGMFDRTHHTLRFAASGREALESVRQTRPDLVLMDIRMPEMDGRTALLEIHKLAGSEILPIIAVTASSLLNDEHLIRGLFAGYIRKPFSRLVLFRELAEFLPPHRPDPIGTVAAGSAAAIADQDDDPARWPELVSALRQLEQGVWPAVRDSGAINEAKEFAKQLQALGERAQCSALRGYAAAVLADAASYSVTKLEARLQEFPKAIAAIAQRTEAGTPAA